MGIRSRKRHRRLALALALALCATLATATACSERPSPAAPDPPRLVTVVGEAEVSAPPDRAVLRISVAGSGETAQAAARRSADRSRAVLEAARAQLADGDSAETEATRLEPRRVHAEGEAPRVVGFESVHTLRIRSADLEGLGALLDAVTGAADASILSLVFELSDPAPVRARALERAAADARVQAEALARGLGLGLGPVHALREVGAGAPEPPPVPMRALAAGGAPGTEVLPREIRVPARVEASFALVPGAGP